MPSLTGRRLLSVPGVHLAFVLVIALALPALLILTLVDLVSGQWHLRLVRVYVLLMGIVTLELTIFWAGILVGAVTANGRWVSADRWLRINFRLQDLWIQGHMRTGRATCGLRVEIENPELARPNAIVMARHLSHADAIFPAYVFSIIGGVDLRYMLKQELQWPPAMDLVGNRLPHVWVDRSPGPGSPLLAEIEQAAEAVDDHTVACIFPEGTFFTPERLGRAVDRLAQTRPDLAEPARKLRHVLPPRPAGSLALLAGAPKADVIVMGHVGLESFSSIRDIVKAVPVQEPVRIRLWRHNRSEIPDDPHDQATWLVERWCVLDEWITDRLAGEAASASRPPREDQVRRPA